MLNCGKTIGYAPVFHNTTRSVIYFLLICLIFRGAGVILRRSFLLARGVNLRWDNCETLFTTASPAR